ncbi:hypothetical protein BU17DRAFT_64428 [Hysterangium stoloniferum]|nr:hypothetical protein BU17DRAFT_64428 [Hysterangium stoloniferum]
MSGKEEYNGDKTRSDNIEPEAVKNYTPFHTTTTIVWCQNQCHASPICVLLEHLWGLLIEPLTTAQLLEQWEKQKKLWEEADKNAREDEEEMEWEYQAALAAEKAEEECQRKEQEDKAEAA